VEAALCALAAPRGGRPDLESAMNIAARRGSAAAYVCGPASMTVEAARACGEAGVALHAEAWEL
jgi:ferredoxin-NADP reductase